MSQLLGELGGIAGNAAGETIAFAGGTAGSHALTPLAEAIAQRAWSTAPIKLPAAAFLAEGVAQGQVDPDEARGWARKQGFDDKQWDAMVNIANVGPALGAAYQAWRRGFLSDAEFDTALRRTGLETQWDDAMRALKDELLDVGAIATAVHRGIVAGAGLLIREPPVGQGKIPHVEQSTLDAVAEFAGHGVTHERARILVGNTGLPLALGQMLRLLNMGEADEDDVRRSIAQSNVRNEYMDVALFLRRQLLTPHEYEEAALRGIITNAEADAGAALHGMEPADAQLLFEIMGRPLPVRAITTGLARGAKLGGTYDDVPEPYRDAIRRSNIRPEYAALAYANRFNYPSAFVLRSLIQAGDITEAEGLDVLLKIGWEPTFAELVAKTWASTSSSTSSSLSSKAKTSALTALHKSYVNDRTDEQKARALMTKLAVPAGEQTAAIAIWDDERAIVREELTATQIKKAIGQPGKDAAWATQRLLERGYNADDAAAFLAE